MTSGVKHHGKFVEIDTHVANDAALAHVRDCAEELESCGAEQRVNDLVLICMRNKTNTACQYGHHGFAPHLEALQVGEGLSLR